jgi:uncharacterized membrane protein
VGILVGLLVAVHILALAAGAANGAMNMVSGPRVASASAETRSVLFAMQDITARVGKYAMATLIVTGLLILGLKWNFTPPNAWFFVKMAGVVGMLVFIALGERQTHKARAGGPEAGAAAGAAKRFGQLTSASFLVVVIAAVYAFD